MRMLSVSEAADLLGVTVDVVRSLVESGELKATRTPGNHRRIPEEGVQQLKKGWGATAKRSNPTSSAGGARSRKRAEPQPRRPAADAAPPWEELVAQRVEAESEDRVQSAEKEKQRLEEWKTFGMGLLRWHFLPAEWHAQAVRELEQAVTAESLPTWLPKNDGEQVVRGIVEGIVTRYRKADEAATKQRLQAERDRQKQKQDLARMNSIIEAGNRYARNETREWERPDQDRARREAARALKEDVTGDWTEAEAKDLVDDVLAEFEDPDESESDEESDQERNAEESD